MTKREEAALIHVEARAKALMEQCAALKSLYNSSLEESAERAHKAAAELYFMSCQFRVACREGMHEEDMEAEEEDE